jgi:16S rRNA G1207 methylase RsmC
VSQAHYFSQDVPPLEPSELRPVDFRVLGHAGVQLVGAAGVFSHGKLDLGTKVLLRTLARLGPSYGLPAEPGALLLDLGCGWGPLALTMAALRPTARVVAVDTNPRALALTKLNAANLGLDNVEVAAPADATALTGIVRLWSNPPIRIGKAALHELLTTWLDRLAPGGAAELVVGRNLGADPLAQWLGSPGGGARGVTRRGSAKGYRVLSVTPS